MRPSLSEGGIVLKCQVSNFSALSWQAQVTFGGDDNNICFALDEHAYHSWIL